MKITNLCICLNLLFSAGCFASIDDLSKEYASKSEMELYYDLNKERFELLDDELFAFKIEINELKKKFLEHESEIINIQGDAIFKKAALFNSKEKGGFQTVDSSSGIFFVSVGEVKPYLDRYRIVFLIGNPYAISFSNPKIKLKWNRSYEKYQHECKAKGITPEFSEWTAALKEKEFAITKELKPRTWNRVEVILNATLDELENVCFSFVSTGTVYMNTESD